MSQVRKFELSNLRVKIGENKYLKASQMYGNKDLVGDKVELYLPGLRYYYADKFPHDAAAKVWGTYRIPIENKIENESLYLYNILDDELCPYDFLVLDKKFLIDRIRDRKRIFIIEPKLQETFELVYFPDVYANLRS